MNPEDRQHWNPERYDRNARFVSDLGMPALALLDPQQGERILDLGCGDGALTVALLESGCEVVGVDASPEMVGAAKARGVDAHVVDGQQLPYSEEFDAVFSNAALHWMKRPERVVDGVWRALRPGGRFVGEFGGHGNVATIVGALEAALADRELPAPDPWFFPAPAAYRALLETRGFEVSSIELFPRPTALPGDVGAWLETFAEAYLAMLPAAEWHGFVADVVTSLRPILCDADGRWLADYVRLRFCATKPS